MVMCADCCGVDPPPQPRNFLKDNLMLLFNSGNDVKARALRILLFLIAAGFSLVVLSFIASDDIEVMHKSRSAFHPELDRQSSQVDLSGAFK